MRELGRLQSEEHFREETQPEHPPASEVCSVIQITPKLARLRRLSGSRNKPNFTFPHRAELTDFSPGDPTCEQRDAA